MLNQGTILHNWSILHKKTIAFAVNFYFESVKWERHNSIMIIFKKVYLRHNLHIQADIYLLSDFIFFVKENKIFFICFMAAFRSNYNALNSHQKIDKVQICRYQYFLKISLLSENDTVDYNYAFHLSKDTKQIKIELDLGFRAFMRTVKASLSIINTNKPDVT